MSVTNKKNNDSDALDIKNINEKAGTEESQNLKPHIVRRNVEDYLADRALKRRLTDIFDDDFLVN
uniref:Uncharacterized protein n=1 Tax=uncultured Thiotrichaceae bacterium TaxID=298394 RepID=A0A6S6SRN1_9GAMM|nr:MAG: Unknown protein [uncultured Thiotrichaceae bacterium]